MKLWENVEYVNKAGKTVQVERKVQVKFSEMTENINRKVRSRGTRAVNALRDAELRVLKGQRSGRVYKVPGTGGKSISASTKKLAKEYGHKLRGGVLYRASAPGEAPARRTGNLRMHWNGEVKTRHTSCGVKVVAALESGEKYAGILENGTNDGKIAPRPFVEKIKEKAMPEIQRIYSEPYT